MGKKIQAYCPYCGEEKEFDTEEELVKEAMNHAFGICLRDIKRARPPVIEPKI